MKTTAIRAFHKLCLNTLVAVYFLILVGGIVRTTGSGMGCPDWPTCFGSFIPPTSVDDLPSDYKEIYSAYRDKKNQKFIKYLRAFGFEQTANQLANDATIRKEENFNAMKTWIEYVNRLVGVAIGFFIIVLFYRSWKTRKENRRIFIFSALTLAGVIFQGWFGSIVVSTNLTTWTITVHMFLALMIVALLVYLFVLSDEKEAQKPQPILKWTLIACISLLFVQIILGTKVREAVDRLVMSGLERNSWIENLGNEFFIHRSFSWLVLIFHVLLLVQIIKTTGKKTLSQALFVLILATILTGVAMAYLGVPAAIQPVHLLIATIAFGLQLLMLFQITVKRVEAK